MKVLKTNINGLKGVWEELAPTHFYGIFGEPNSGKSLLAYQIASQYNSVIIATEDMDYDAFSFVKNKWGSAFKEPAVVKARSLRAFLKLFGLEIAPPKKGKRGGEEEDATKSTKFEIVLNRLIEYPLIDDNGIMKNKDLLVIDSLTSPVKNTIPSGRQNMEARAAVFRALFGSLDEIAEKWMIPIILIMHESKDPATKYDAGRPWGGSIMMYSVKYFFQMSSASGTDWENKRVFEKKIRRRRFLGRGEDKDYHTLQIKKDYGYI